MKLLAQVNRLENLPLHSLDEFHLLLHPARILGVWAVAQDEPLARFDFVADEFGQASVIVFHALEKKQQRIVPAPFEFVADSANLPQIAVRVGN
ncbi:MAG: hypothetical protein K1X78_14020 [Verrucomicrobiaceae bacterium]|nr:hypothetical protein [Verrucomicrobiaceae bacterium]